MSGVGHVRGMKNSEFEFDPHRQRTGLTKEQMHQFLLEEKREGVHPSLKNYR
jgi:hypothetical protein